MKEEMNRIINVGCGKGIIEGAINIDNSISVRLSRHMFLSNFMYKIGLVNDEMMDFIKFCREHDVTRGDCRNLPAKGNSVAVVYASHLCENIYEDDLNRFILEAWRVLKWGGVLRLSTGDLDIRIKKYNKDHDAEIFMNSFALRHEKKKPTFTKRLRYLFLGERKPKWMFNARSLMDRVESVSGFKGQILKPGETLIPDKIAKNMDLYERSDESVYIEFIKEAN